MIDEPIYRCTEPNCLSPLTPSTGGLTCSKGHYFPFAPNTKVPVFARELEGANEYACKNSAIMHDNALRWVFDTFKADEAALRKSLVARLNLVRGDRVLVTGAGAGNDLPYLIDNLGGQGAIYAQDVSQEMLLTAVQRYQTKSDRSNLILQFSISDAMNLPFHDNQFDAAYHFGGINTFLNIRKGIDEMNRVVRSGGKVVIGDESVAPWLKDTEYGKMLIRNNPLYASDVPLNQLPVSAKEVRLSWELCNCFYVIDFLVNDAMPDIDIDVHHLGVRGGSIRTRYFGQLEGIDPALRDLIYTEAERNGVSRFDYIESLLRSGLSKLR